MSLVFGLVSGKLSTHRHFMHHLEFIIEWLPIPLQAWILVLLVRKGLTRRFPVFLFYTAYVTVIDLARVVLVGTAAYIYVYWSTEAIAVLASVLAIHESFRAIFGIFYRLTWFRFVWPGTVAIIWIYCAWRAWVHPPPHFARAGAALISGSIASSFTIVGLVFLFFLLAKVIISEWYPYEFHIVYGLGISSLGMVAGVLLRSEFGTKYVWLTEWGPPLAYLVAVTVWLSGFLRTEPKVSVDAPMEVILQQMQEDLSIVRRIRRALMAGRR
jgi:hypothetical protein